MFGVRGWIGKTGADLPEKQIQNFDFDAAGKTPELISDALHINTESLTPDTEPLTAN